MHNPSRFCTRCHKELTDAASMEFGVGPICRDLDNALLAKLYPSDVPSARSVFNDIDLALVAPVSVETINKVYTNLFADDASKRDDWRDDVKRIEWALSFPENNYLRAQLTQVVAALGYVGLAALWNGEAKTGKAFVSFDAPAGRIVIQCARSKAGNAAFRVILGRKFHSQGTLNSLGIEKAAWSFPAKEHAAVMAAVAKHYPNNDGLKETCEKAKQFTLSARPAKPVITIDTETAKTFAAALLAPSVTSGSAPVVISQFPAPAAPKCSIAKVGVLLKVTTPYKAAYVNELKTSFKWTDRRWNATERVWEVPLNHEAKVKELVQKYFGESPAVVEAP